MMLHLSHFENKYRGKRLFVVGNGPSLNETPLEQMQDEYTFAMNNIATIYDKTSWRPSFYWNVTRQVDKHQWWFDNAMKTIKLGIPSFVAHTSSLVPYLLSLPNDYNVCVVRYLGAFLGEQKVASWSKDPMVAIVHYRMSIYGLMQLAFWMGFDPIYLVGCDVSFSMNPDECHYTPDYEGTFEWTPELVEHENHWHAEAHKEIKKYADMMKVRVFNATVGGNLEVYPRVKIHDLLRRNWF